MKMELPSPVLHSLFALNKAGYEAFVVGGCVRDALMGKEPFDWDITTSALPEQTLSVFKNERTIETGIQHGTVTVIVEDTPMEITTYRVDGTYSDGRHPDSVVFSPSLIEDLKRRDFTINAMAYHPNIGLVDPFGGQDDLHHHRIRCVGDPEIRFTEDALRILRGLRFSSSLGFAIEATTAESIHQLAPTLSCISAERVSAEFTKLLCGVNVAEILSSFTDVLNIILPHRLAYARIAKYVSHINATPLVRYSALLFTESEDVVASVALGLKFSRRFTDDLITLNRNKSLPITNEKRDIVYLLHHIGPNLIRDYLSIRSVYDDKDYSNVLEKAEQLSLSGACYKISDLAINGADLIAYSIAPGPRIGATLSALLEAVMDGNCPNTKEALLNYIEEKRLC